MSWVSRTSRSVCSAKLWISSRLHAALPLRRINAGTQSNGCDPRRADDALSRDGDRAHLARVKILERLLQLLFRVHHKRAIASDRLVDRLCRQQEQFGIAGA